LSPYFPISLSPFLPMDFILALLLLALALVALAYPLYRAQMQTAAVNASTLDDLLAQRDGVYATLRDLELDQQLGKLDAADYNALREKYMLRATEILQELDVLRGEGGGKDASAEIEREVAAMRKVTRDERRETRDDRRQTTESQSLSAVSSRPLANRQSSDLKCANCGRAYKVGDQFCARCGYALR